MSYAGQQIEYAIVSKEFADEALFLETYLKLTDQSTILETFTYFIKSGLMTKEYFYPKGHVVCAKFKDNTNRIVVNDEKCIPFATIDSIKLKIRFFETILFESKQFNVDIYSLVFVGKKEECIILANRIKNLLRSENSKSEIFYKIEEK